MNKIIVIILILFTSSLSAQEPCEDGYFRISQKNEIISIVLIKDGYIFPHTNIKENLIFAKLTNHYKPKNTKDINSSNVKTSLRKTKASLSLC